MTLNTKVCKLESPKDINSKFKYWLKLTSLTPRKFIYIPIKENSYFEKQTGTLCNAFQLNFKDNKLNNVALILNKEKVVKIEDKELIDERKVISIDIGLKNLITTNQGDIFHKNFIDKLTYYDNRIQKLQKELQRRNIKLSDNKRYVKMTKKLREYIKNECNRIINRIIEIHNPKEIIMEHLKFKSFGFFKRLNRLMSNFGLRYIKSKIASIQEETDIKITEVNPAYTSQECRKCGFIDNKNRKQDNFKCLRCGHKCHADVNSTFNIERRSFDTRINIYTNYKKVKQLLLSSFKESDGSGRVTRSCTQHQLKKKKPFSKTREIKHECQI